VYNSSPQKLAVVAVTCPAEGRWGNSCKLEGGGCFLGEGRGGIRYRSKSWAFREIEENEWKNMGCTISVQTGFLM